MAISLTHQRSDFQLKQRFELCHEVVHLPYELRKVGRRRIVLVAKPDVEGQHIE
jgi:hypothetical protein